MWEGVPVAIYLQSLSLLMGLIGFALPLAITILGVYFSRRFSNRIDSMAADLDEALDRIKALEASRPDALENGK